MKALSLWQPWAHLMAVGAKRNETRSWPTGYRGDVAIHAAKRRKEEELQTWFQDEHFLTEMPHGFHTLAFGAIVAVVTLYECIHSEWADVPPNYKFKGFDNSVPEPLSAAEKAFGDYTPGRFVWQTRNLRRLKTPVSCRGRQGFWNLDATTERLVREQL